VGTQTLFFAGLLIELAADMGLLASPSPGLLSPLASHLTYAFQTTATLNIALRTGRVLSVRRLLGRFGLHLGLESYSVGRSQWASHL